MESYKATIIEPGKSQPAPDAFGTMTIPGQASMGAPSPVPLRSWAKLVLPSCSKGAYCVITRMEQVEVERITQEEIANAPANK